MEDANAYHPEQHKRRKEVNSKHNGRVVQKQPSRKEKERKHKQEKQGTPDSRKQVNKSQQDITDVERDKYIERLEKEYNKKRKELLLEAENAVRVREEAFNQELIRLNQELERHKQMQRDQLEVKKKSSGLVGQEKSSVVSFEEDRRRLTNGELRSEKEKDGGKGCIIQ